MPKVTIEQLAIMMQKEFRFLSNKIETQIANFRAEVNDRFERLEAKFDSLEHIVNGHTNRIERIEDRVLVLENKNRN